MKERESMKQQKKSGVETSSVAWFKLAEYVGRGERERALNLYRLLTHSLVDQAFIKKLEADLWIAFDAKEAEECYKSAAYLYKIAGKHTEAFLMYQLLCERYGPTLHYLEQCFELAAFLELDAKKHFFVKKLMAELVEKGAFVRALSLFQLYEKVLSNSEKIKFYRHFVIVALRCGYDDPSVIQDYTQKMITLSLKQHEGGQVHHFLNDLQPLHEGLYKHAVHYASV